VISDYAIGRFPAAEKYICDFLQRFCPSATIKFVLSKSSPGIFDCHLEFPDHKSKTISFGRDLVEDLEGILKRSGSPELIRDEFIKSRIHFIAYIALGESGLLPDDFFISDHIVSERGEWDLHINVSTHYVLGVTRATMIPVISIVAVGTEHTPPHSSR